MHDLCESVRRRSLPSRRLEEATTPTSDFDRFVDETRRLEHGEE
jgi:hypothetical protein